MLVSMTCMVPDDEGTHSDATAKDTEGGTTTTCGACAESRRFASGAAFVNTIHLGEPGVQANIQHHCAALQTASDRPQIEPGDPGVHLGKGERGRMPDARLAAPPVRGHRAATLTARVAGEASVPWRATAKSTKFEFTRQ